MNKNEKITISRCQMRKRKHLIENKRCRRTDLVGKKGRKKRRRIERKKRKRKRRLRTRKTRKKKRKKKRRPNLSPRRRRILQRQVGT